ncbi:MAG TPA: ATP-binding cassette domain-containing protein, partial [Anaerolineae bacterium]
MSIRIANLSYRYSRQPQDTLSDISAVFKPGEVTLFAGASGCGKTTLIRCINGLIPHSYAGGLLAGSITLYGSDTSRMSLSQVS